MPRSSRIDPAFLQSALIYEGAIKRKEEAAPKLCKITGWTQRRGMTVPVVEYVRPDTIPKVRGAGRQEDALREWVQRAKTSPERTRRMNQLTGANAKKQERLAESQDAQPDASKGADKDPETPMGATDKDDEYSLNFGKKEDGNRERRKSVVDDVQHKMVKSDMEREERASKTNRSMLQKKFEQHGIEWHNPSDQLDGALVILLSQFAISGKYNLFTELQDAMVEHDITGKRMEEIIANAAKMAQGA